EGAELAVVEGDRARLAMVQQEVRRVEVGVDQAERAGCRLQRRCGGSQPLYRALHQRLVFVGERAGAAIPRAATGLWSRDPLAKQAAGVLPVADESRRRVVLLSVPVQ